jgi:hypothetical protein
MDDVVHATSSHPPRQIAPIPLTQTSSSSSSSSAAVVAVAVAAQATARTAAAASAPAEPTTAKRSRWQPHGESQPPQNRPRTQATTVGPRASCLAPQPQPRPHSHSHAATSTATASAKAAAATIAPTTTAANPGDLFPARRYRKAIPDFVPIRPDEFASHHHPLTIRTARDVVRFFPFATSAAATFAGLSGLLAGGIANRVLGGDVPPAYFMAGYLVLFLLNFLTHCFAAKGTLFFQNKRRFLGLLAANALILLPHFIAYSILVGIAAK